MLAVALAALACTPGSAELERSAQRGVVVTRVVACDAEGRRRTVRRAVSRAGAGTVVQDVEPSGRAVVWSEVTSTATRHVGRVVRLGIASRRILSRRVVARSSEPFEVGVGATSDGTMAWLIDRRGEDRLVLQSRGAPRRLLLDRGTGLRDMAVHYDATLVWKDAAGGQRYRDVRTRPRPGCAAHRREVVTLDTPDVLLTGTATAHAACFRDTGVKIGVYLTSPSTEARPAGVDRHWLILTEARAGTGACSGEGVVVIDLRQGGRYLGTERPGCDGPRAGQPVRVDDQGPVLHWTRDGMERSAAL